jgi:hypothetical protein
MPVIIKWPDGVRVRFTACIPALGMRWEGIDCDGRSMSSCVRILSLNRKMAKMAGIPSYHRIAVIHGCCGDHDIRAAMSYLSGEIPPLGDGFTVGFSNQEVTAWGGWALFKHMLESLEYRGAFACRTEKKYGKKRLRNYYHNDYEWGMLNGILSALGWVLVIIIQPEPSI